MAETVLVGTLIPAIRIKLVTDLVERVHSGEVDPGTALLMLDVLGLTSDRETLGDAVAATDLALGVRDGMYDPRHVDPELSSYVSQSEAVEFVASNSEAQALTFITRLAAPAANLPIGV